MVIINKELVKAEMERRGLSQEGLADRMGVHFNTVRNILSDGPLNHSTQVALFTALGGLIPFQELFIVTPGPDGAGTSEKREEAVA